MTNTSPARRAAPEKNKAFIVLSVLFIVLTLAIIAATLQFFRLREKSIVTRVHENLSAVADLKVDQITQWCSERRGDAGLIAADPYLARQFDQLVRGTENGNARSELTGILERLLRTKEYCSVHCADTAGTILLSTTKKREGKRITASDRKVFRAALTRRTTVLSDLHRDGDSTCSDIHFSVYVPITTAADNSIGCLILDLDPSQFLFPLIQSWPTPSPSAEVLLVRKEEGEVLFLNELRHKKNTALKLRHPLSDTTLPAAMALSGITGTVSGKDYRGVSVLAETRAIPGTTWYMIAKIDSDEALREIHHLFIRSLVFIVLVVLLVGLTAVLYQRHRSSRIYKMLFLAEHEKRKLVTTLAASEQRFKHLFESMIEGVALHDVIFDENGKPCDYRLITVNPAYEKHTGLSAAAAEGKLATELYGIGTPPYLDEYSGVAITGTPYRFETYFPPMEKHFSISVFSPEKNRFATVFEDITERKRTAERIRESEERFRRIFEDGMYGMAIVDKSFSFVQANSAFCSMTGYSEAELQACTFSEITHPDHRSEDMENVRKVLDNTLPFYKTEKRYLRKDGETIWGSAIITCLRDSNGDFQYFMAMIDNITDRKKAEDALVAEKERLLVTLRSIGDAVIATDVNGRIVLMNKIAEELTGWPLAEARGKLLTEVFVIINELTRQQCENPVDKVLKTGTIVTLANHTVLLSRDGRELVIADSGAPIRDRESATIGVVLVFRDNTEKQKTREALQKAQQLESLGVLAGGIAHDFNNLLGGLFGYMDLARESIPEHEAVAAYIDKAFSVFARAKDLTTQLLTFAKGGAPARKVTALGPLLRDTIGFALSGSSIRTEFSLQPDLWPSSIDNHQISQVIDNLIINARDAMPRGGVITIAAENIPENGALPPVLTPGSYIRISISDQGTGIPPEHLEHIFDPFFTTKQKGSGLGLAVSYSIISRHSGTIEVKSVLGSGTTFKVFLPASNERTAPVSIAADTRQTEHHGGGTVLIMDDEVYIRDITASMLQAIGYDCLKAASGEEAIELFTERLDAGKKIKIALLDLTIPGGMGGKETIKALRKIDKECLIVASSGYSDDPIIAHPEEYGFTGSLRKPYRRSELVELFNKILPAE